MTYDLLADLLPLLGQYQQATPAAQQSVPAFIAWAQQANPAALPLVLPDPPAVARTPASPYETPESIIFKLVTFVYRYMRGYVRLALADTLLVGFDDFIYLISLFAGGPRTRTELMTRNIHEKAAGTEVIRRLLKHGLVSEEPHATDRRRKELRINEAGRTLLFSIMGRMSQVAQMGVGDLNSEELQQLVTLLHRLDTFHYPLFSGPRVVSFAELVAAHFPDITPNWPPVGARAAE